MKLTKSAYQNAKNLISGNSKNRNPLKGIKFESVIREKLSVSERGWFTFSVAKP
jgi:hypothetical protein